MIKIINQAIDTFKEHIYPLISLTKDEMIDFNDFVNDLILLKKKAQSIVSKNQDERIVVETIHNHKFNILSSTQRGFAVTIKNGDVSISFKRFKEVSKQPCIKIEYRAEYLARYGYIKCVTQTNDFIKKILPKYKNIASEIHLCTDIQGYDFTILDLFRFKSRTRKKELYHEEDNSSYFEGLKFTGFTLGKGDFMIRVYNKTHEINKFPNKAFVKTSRWIVSEDYEEDKEVWRVEVQIRREKLKHYLNDSKMLDDSVNCLNSVSDIWNLFIEKFSHKEMDEKETLELIIGKKKLKKGGEKLLSKYAIRKRFQRAETSNLWNSISPFFETKGRNLTYLEDISKPSSLYVKNSFKSLVSTLTKHLRGRFDKYALVDILLEANEEEKKKKGWSIFDTAKIKSVEHFNDTKILYETYSDKFGLIIEDEFKQYENDLENNILSLFSVVFPKEKEPKEFLKTLEKKCNFKNKEFFNYAN